MSSKGVLAYLYVRDDVLNFNTSTSEHPSKLDEYLEAVEMDDANVWGMGIGGQGSSDPQNGTSGAVLIVW